MTRRIVPVLALILLLAFAVTAQAAKDGQAAYSGNPQSMKYHNSGCRHFNCKACTVRFSSPEEARAKGYVACKVCKG